MSEITTVNGTEVQEGKFRDIGTITIEIKAIYQSALESELSYAVKLGRKLTEAKELVDHGEWGKWIKENLPFSQDKAGMMMKIYENYGADQESLFGEINSETFRNLGISQAFALLQVPENERENFVKENNVEDLSVRELKKKIEEANAERDAQKTRADALDADNRMLRQSNVDLNKQANSAKELQQKAESEEDRRKKAEAEKKTAEEKAAVAERKLSDAVEAERKAREALAEATANPKIPEEKIKELERDAEEKAKRTTEELVRRATEEKNSEIEELKKKLTMANPDVAVFKQMFEQLQEAQNRVAGSLMKIKQSDPETAKKLSAALTATAGKFMEAIQ